MGNGRFASLPGGTKFWSRAVPSAKEGTMNRPKIVSGIGSITLIASVAVSTLPAFSAIAAESHGDTILLAQAGGTEPRDLEPRYKPVPPTEPSWYNSGYMFALTRGVADSTMHPAAKAPLFIFTVPLDLAFLPVAAIGGLFG